MKVHRFVMLYVFLICFLLFSEGNCFFSWQLKELQKSHKSVVPNLRKQKLILAFSKAMKDANRNWVDLTKFTDEKRRRINIYMDNGKVMCGAEKQAIKVVITHSEKIAKTKGLSQYALHIDYGDLAAHSQIVNPLPIVSPGWDEQLDLGINMKGLTDKSLNSQGKLFPDKFDVYIVCVKKGEEASLVPASVSVIDFVDGSWEAVVEISLHKNPVAPFGRQFKVRVLENVKVLKNGKKTFIWPSPLKDILEVYTFYKMTAQKKKKRCFLSRDSESSDIKLNCEDWGFRLNRRLFSAEVLIGLGMANIWTLIYNSTITAKDVDYNFYIDRDLKSHHPRAHIDDEMLNRPGVDKLDADDFHKLYTKKVLQRKKLWNSIGINICTILLWLGIMAICEAVSVGKVIRDLRRMSKELKRATFIYPWKLQTIKAA